MSSKKEKPICRFHPDNKCPKKLPFQQPAPALIGKVLIPKVIVKDNVSSSISRFVDSKCIIRLLRIHDGKCKLNPYWTLETDKLKVVLTYTPKSPNVIINNFNRKIYSAEEIAAEINKSIYAITYKESVIDYLDQYSRAGVG